MGGVVVFKKFGLGKCLEGIDVIFCYGYYVLYCGDDVVILYFIVLLEGNVVVIRGEKRDRRGLEGRVFYYGRFIM